MGRTSARRQSRQHCGARLWRFNPNRAKKGIKSTLYNPLSSPDEIFDALSFTDNTKEFPLIFITFDISMISESQDFVQTDFGKFQRESTLSYQY